MPLSPLEYLRHILDESEYLIKESQILSREEFLRGETLKRAFVRSLEVIGEASTMTSSGMVVQTKIPVLRQQLREILRKEQTPK